jgi:biotin carboxyl carrier protein
MPLTQNERQGILLAAAATAVRRPDGPMRLRISIGGERYEVEVEVLLADTPAEEAEEDPAIPDSVLQPPLQPDIRDEDKICRTPIAGAVVSVAATRGRWLQKDDPVAVIEAMKMQTTIGAPVEGIVEEVSIAPGDAVKPGQMLCRMG